MDIEGKSSAFGIKESSGEEKGSYGLAPMVGWFEFKAITLLLLSYEAFLLYKVWKVIILMSHVHKWLYHVCVKDECDTRGPHGL